MSWKESDHTLAITTAYPFLRKVEVNFVKENEKLHIIATGAWRRDLELVPMAYVGDMSFTVEKADSKHVLGLMVKKYGQAHVDKYFKHPVNSISLVPGSINYEVETVIAAAFDAVSESYEQAITRDATQRYMREASAEMLSRYYFPGAELLDLGAGVMYETRKYIADSRLTAVECSQSLQRLIRRQFTEVEQGNLEIFTSLKDAVEAGRGYDIVFSTFGYLELNSLNDTLDDVRGLLKQNGVFIAGFWNSGGFLDNLISLVQGNVGYVSGKRKGMVPVGQSRYSLAASTHKVSEFVHIEGLKLEELRGVCTVIPPYNHGISQRLAGNSLFRKLDWFIGRVPLFASYSDFVLAALRKHPGN